MPAGPDPRNFSPIDDEPPLRWWRWLGVVPRDGLGVGRRALLLALLAWLPIVAWAIVDGRLVHPEAGEPLLQHYGVHVRCLVAIPLFVLAEATLDRTGRAIVAQFAASGVVDEATRPRFDAVLAGIVRLRDATLPWALAVGAACAWSYAQVPAAGDDAVSWAVAPDGTLRFGGWWAMYVARPLFVALLLGWAWRLALVTVWMWRVGRLPLALVPTHPDRAGGLGFCERLPAAFAPLTLGLAAVLGSRWAHEVLHHGADLAAFRLPALAFVAGWTLVLLAPLGALAPPLLRVRRAALARYGAFVGLHGRAVHARWIERREDVDKSMLEPAGFGPLADAAAAYDAVARMRPAPIGRIALLGILVPIGVPFAIVTLLQVPFRDLALKLLEVIV